MGCHPSRRRLDRRFALGVLGVASRQVGVDGEIESAARACEASGIQPDDALHLASAGEGGADAARFLQQSTTGTGKCTKERRECFADTLLDELLAK